MDNLGALGRKYSILRDHLDEGALRLCAAADSVALGRGGVTRIAKASKLSRTTIYTGLRELKEFEASPGESTGKDKERIRKPGGGRKSLTDRDRELLSDLDRLVDPVTRGDPESPLRWTCKSTTKLAKELRNQGHRISQRSVWNLLDQIGYSMQSNRKTLEGSNHPDRDSQFQYISAKVKDFQGSFQPVISVDAKKKELIGRYKNNGQEWCKTGFFKIHNVLIFNRLQI